MFSGFCLYVFVCLLSFSFVCLFSLFFFLIKLDKECLKLNFRTGFSAVKCE